VRKTGLTLPRKLHRGHFAFMRAVVQGLDTSDSWRRYLQDEGEHRDARIVRKTIARIRDEFAAAARRHNRHGIARLVQIDVASSIEVPASLSLEAFVAERGMQDFSEAEQLEAYRAEYGIRVQPQARRARLISKQLDALRWLEELVAEPPAAGDAVASWLNPDLAKRLEGAGIYTLRKLVERINGLGKNWARSIPAIGSGKAERIVEWVRAHQDSIGIPIGAHVLTQRSELSVEALAQIVPRATAIVPLDKLLVPAELDGSAGLYRAPRHLCLLAAKNDLEAILVWLRSKRGLSSEQKAELKRKRGIDLAVPEGPLDWLQYLSHTQRTYLKEVERFLLWAILEHKKPLSSMTVEDCEVYRAFLSAPSPVERWCGPRARERWSPLWRPFEGPLSPRAQQQTITVLKNLYGFLVDHAYVVKNPWTAIGVPKARRGADPNRSFTHTQWQFVERRLATLPVTCAARRMRFALHLLYATGLRLSEVVSRKVGDLHFGSHSYVNDIGNEEVIDGWVLNVVAEGGKHRTVPVPMEVIGELSEYLVSRGLDRDPASSKNRGAYLLGKVTDIASRAPWASTAKAPIDPKEGIAASTLAKELKRFFVDCAAAITLDNSKDGAHFAAASTHWMRHTFGSHAVAAEIPLEVVQQNLGHASRNTTAIYRASDNR
jgi:site-specific recombinase XerD